MAVVYSTLSCDQSYRLYDCEGVQPSDNDAFRTPNATFMCLIKGKANITNKVLVTPKGVATTVTDEQLAQLKRCKMFMTHLENGYLFIDEKAKSATAEKADDVAKNMQSKDKSAPPTKDDIKKSLNKNVKIVTDNDK